MSPLKIYLALSLFLFSLAGWGQSFTPGNIVVCRIGDGTSSITGDLTFPVFLDEYTPAGSLIRTIAMPVTTSGSNLRMTMWGGSRNVMGMINLSADKQYLTIAGYDAPVGSDGLYINNSVPVPLRVIGLIRYDGQVNTSMAVTNWSDNNGLNSVVTTNGTEFWCAGTGSINGGIRYATTGSTTTTQIISTPTALRAISIQNGQLYIAVGDVFAVGAGLPVTSGQTTTALALGTGTKNQFFMVDLNPAIAGPDVLYVADLTNGIRKFSLIGGVWTLNGGIGGSADIYKGLTGIVNGNSVTLFATRKGANGTTIGGGELVRVIDNSGYAGTLTGTPTVLATTPVDMASFRGVAVAPVQAPACAVPASLAALNITPASAQLQWNAMPGVAGYEYALTTSPTPPASGTPVTTTTYNVTGLIQGQTWYFHVRTNCGNFNTSSWSTVSFVPACSAPPVPVISNIGYTPTIKWNTVYGASGYEYAVTTNATPPASGTATTDTGFTASNLSSVTQYYVHIRSNCNAGGFSPWTTRSFATSCLNPIVNASSNGDAKQFNWKSVNGATAYEYALTNYGTPPLGGTTIKDTSIQFSGLNAGNNYYLHVRTKCTKTGGISSWTTVPFQTTGFNVYPNPVTSTLTVKVYGPVATNGEAVITDAMGSIVKKILLTNSSADVNLQGLKAGIYFIRYSNGANQYTVKVLKQNNF